ncbi:MAG: phytanoyl-CoA dioxygenase family protein [Chloroflexota bacterium]
MKLTMGERMLELGGSYLNELSDSTDMMADLPSLRQRLEEDGYLLIRNLHNRDKVKAARRTVLENLEKAEQLAPDAPLMDGIIAPGKRGKFWGGSKTVTHSRPFLDLVESPELMTFFIHFLAGPSLTYDFKWLRVVSQGNFSGAHYDIVYMGRGTTNVYTVWTPLGDVSYEMGPLTILAGSHCFDRIRETYGNMDVDRDKVTGWFSDDPIELVDRYGGQWKTAEFEMGDALIFGMYTMHGSLTNTTNRFRVSCDTRYQRADEPVDERWVGENPLAHYAWMKGETVPMKDARKEWGV